MASTSIISLALALFILTLIAVPTVISLQTALAQPITDEDTLTQVTKTSNITASASEIELSAEPIYQEEQISISDTPINDTHIQSIVSGNGTINLPNSTETINNINNGSYIISTKDGSVIGKEVWSTKDETENVTTTFYGIIRFGMEEGTSEAIVIAVVDANSTGMLAPLDGMILAGQVEFRPDESRLVTLWEWQSGIPLPTGNDTNTTSSSGLELSAQPVWVEHARITGVIPMNETHSSVTFSGNGTLTLPNNNTTAQTINTTSNGSALVSIATESGQGKITIRTQDWMETATVTFYEIDRHPDITTGESRGIVIGVINTNATGGMLTLLNGMILVGINESQTTTGEGLLTFWEWKS
jgi:hypothetical protein